MAFPYILTQEVCTVYIDGIDYSMSRDAVNMALVSAAIEAEDADAIREFVAPVEAVTAAFSEALSDVTVEINHGQVYVNGFAVHNQLTERLLEVIREGFNVSAWIEFVKNIYANPLQSAIEEFFLFLEKGRMPITEDGHFLAYKRIRDDYTDVYTGTIDNSVGAVVEIDRSLVDTDRSRTCSTGLHFCSKDYLPNFSPGSKVVLVKINPADIVSIPSDYSNTKGRCCRYEVVAEIDPADVGLIEQWNVLTYDYNVNDYDDFEDELEEEMLGYYSDEDDDEVEESGNQADVREDFERYQRGHAQAPVVRPVEPELTPAQRLRRRLFGRP